MSVLSSIFLRTFWMRYCAVGLLIAMSADAAPELTIRAEHVTVSARDTSDLISIYLQNTVDTVVGYQFRLLLDRPDIAFFEEAFDTSGTLSSGWDLVHVRSIDGKGLDVKVVGLANDITVSGGGAPILPSQEERLLVRIPFRILTIPDSLTDRTVNVTINESPGELSFSRPNGTTIGLTCAVIADTLCFRCTQWAQNVCLLWELVAAPPCDTIGLTLDTIPVFDSVKLVTIPGSITICNRTVYDVDVDGNGIPMTISDLVALIRYIAGDTSGVGDPRSADVNGDCVINWGDAILLDSLFTFGGIPEIWPPLPCACDHPVRVCCWQIRGNLDGDIHHMVDLTDLSILIAYLTGTSPSALKCVDEANIDGRGIIDLSDMSYLIAYLVGAGAPPAACP